MGSAAHNRATAKYDAENTRFFGLKFNKKTDADIIAFLEGAENKQAAVKEAIRAYISKK